jgi:hypothetical protein
MVSQLCGAIGLILQESRLISAIGVTGDYEPNLKLG